MQECDRLKDLATALPDHAYVPTSGRGKMHGLVVFYRKERFRVRAKRTVFLDEEELSLDGEGDERRRRGGTRQTKNVGLMVALEDIVGSASIVVATTHL